MTSDDVRAQCPAMINQLLTRGLERPLYVAAVTPDGSTTLGSSETVTGGVQPLVKNQRHGCALPPVSAAHPLPVCRSAGEGRAWHDRWRACRVVPCLALRPAMHSRGERTTLRGFVATGEPGGAASCRTDGQEVVTVGALAD
jgi:hypothetical protein